MRRYLPFLLLALVLSGALFYRWAYVAAVHIDEPIQADAKTYINGAFNMLRHGIYSMQDPPGPPQPDSYRSPGLPALIALCVLVADRSFYTLLVGVQVALSVLTVLLTYALGRRFLSCGPALAAAGLTALSPHLVTMTCYALTETLFAFLLALSLLLLTLALERPALGWKIGAGLSFGCAYLTNETSLFLLPFFALLLWPRKRGGADVFMRKRGLAVCLLFFFLFPAAWATRNAISLPPGAGSGANRAITTLSHGGYPAFIHNDPAKQFQPWNDDPQQAEFGGSLHGFLTILWERAQERPLRYLSWYLLEKPYWLWTWDIQEGQGDVFVYQVVTSLFHENDFAFWTRQAMKWAHPWIVACAALGLPLLLLRRRVEPAAAPPALILVFGLLGYYSVMYAIFAPWTRYAVPLRPELYLAALWSLSWGYGRLRARTRQRATRGVYKRRREAYLFRP